MRLAGRSAVVVGGGSGIGRACALRFAREGAGVVVADIHEGRGRTVVEEIAGEGGRAAFALMNVKDEAQVAAGLELAVQRFGRLDVLLLSMAAGYNLSVPDTTPEQWDHVVDTHLKGMYLAGRHAVPRMAASGGGSIISIASVAGLMAVHDDAAYCGAKGGMIALARAMAIDHARQRIRVNCICPGWIDSPSAEAYFRDRPDPAAARASATRAHPLGRLGRPEDIANAALFLASDEAEWITGIALVVDGGLTCALQVE
jgi:meso-butanediol dehydrogenase/(S,S)-butanediol dehydrogenase/diacetyl reductase